VDDEVFVCEAIKMMLGFDGHLVETASNGAEGLVKFENGKYDVIFTDFAMPVMQGDKFAAAIKERSPKQPVIMLSAHGSMLLATGKQLPGVDMILEKPFRLDTLRQAIEKVLSVSPETVATGGTTELLEPAATKAGSAR
jgi:DNA-binding NtrC family response regulator